MAKKNKYRVTQTDNLLELAKKFQTSVSSLLQTNGIQSLTPGQTIRVPTQKAKGQAGYYSTGDGERKIISIGGQEIRMGPNSSISPQQTVSPMQGFLNNLMGTGTPAAASMQPAVAPNSLAGIPIQGLTSQQYSNLQTPTTPQTLQTRNPQWGQATGGFAGRDGADITLRGYAPASTQVPAFSSAGSQARMNEAYVPAPIQPGYQDYGQRINQGQTPTNALPQQAPLITPSSRAAGQAQFLSGNGLNPNSGYIPTRGDVWEMKVAARRRRIARQGEPATAVEQMTENTGNAVNQGMSWRA